MRTVQPEKDWDPYHFDQPLAQASTTDDGGFEYETRLDPIAIFRASKSLRQRLALILSLVTAIPLFGLGIYIVRQMGVEASHAATIYLCAIVGISIFYRILLELRARKRAKEHPTFFVKVRVTPEGAIVQRDRELGAFSWQDVLRSKLLNDILFYRRTQQPAQSLVLPLAPLDKSQRRQVLRWAQSNASFAEPPSQATLAKIMGVEAQRLSLDPHPEAIDYRATINRSDIFRQSINFRKIAGILLRFSMFLGLVCLAAAAIDQLIPILLFSLGSIVFVLLIWGGVQVWMHYRRINDVKQRLNLQPSALQIQSDTDRDTTIFRYEEILDLNIQSGLLRFKTKRTGPQRLLINVRPLNDKQLSRFFQWLKDGGAQFADTPKSFSA